MAYLVREPEREFSVRSLVRIALVVALGLSVSACDKCGNWFQYGAPKTCGAEPLPK